MLIVYNRYYKNIYCCYRLNVIKIECTSDQDRCNGKKMFPVICKMMMIMSTYNTYLLPGTMLSTLHVVTSFNLYSNPTR